MTTQGYRLGSILALGGNTAHTFANCIACEGLSEIERYEFLHSALRELVSAGLATWVFESDYGDKPPTKPDSFSTESFERDWSRCFIGAIRRHDIPCAENPTLFIDPTETLPRALDEYESRNFANDRNA